MLINAGDIFFFGSQNHRSRGLKKISKQQRDFTLKELHFSMGINVDINLWLKFSLCSR